MKWRWNTDWSYLHGSADKASEPVMGHLGILQYDAHTHTHSPILNILSSFILAECSTWQQSGLLKKVIIYA